MLGKLLAKRFGLLSLFSFLMFVLFSSFPQRTQALDTIEGAGFIVEEGDYLSDQFWTNDDWINVGTELITSGGSASFELYGLAIKYAISIFFTNTVKPIEFWLTFIQEWRNETGLRAPEDFRMMTGMMLDERVDIAWLQEKSADLSEKEGWDHIFPYPWTILDDQAEMPEIDGGMSLANPESTVILASASPATPVTPLAAKKDPLLRIEETTLRCGSSKLFERYANHLARAGYFANTLGIPKGSTYINLSYHGGVNGADGFFIAPDGKCYILEMKWYRKGGGKLGVIKVLDAKKIYQTGPEWFCKVLFRVRKEDPTRFARIMRDIEGTSLEGVMKIVDVVFEGQDDLRKIYGLAAEEIENFTSLNNILEFLETKKGKAVADELIGKLTKFIDQDIHVGIISKTGRAIRHMSKVVAQWDNWRKILSGEDADKARRFANRVLSVGLRTP